MTDQRSYMGPPNPFFPVFPQQQSTTYGGQPFYAQSHRYGIPPSNGWFSQPLRGGGGRGPPRKKQKGQHEPPSLHQMQAENKIKTKKHYRGGSGGRRPRWSVPRAPEHATKYLFPTPGHSQTSPGLLGFHTATPAACFGSADEKGYWRNGLGSMDKDAVSLGAAAGIDMFGSNAPIEAASEEDDPFGLELHVEEEGDMAGLDTPSLPTAVRQRLDEQAAYICQLEETNLKLQEKIYLLEQHVRDLESGAAGGLVDGPGPEEGIAQISDGSAGHHAEEDAEEEDEDASEEASAES